MKSQGRNYRHSRLAKRIRGTDKRPRLVVFRSKKHIYAQLIVDTEAKTVVFGSTLTKEFKDKKIKGSTKEGAKAVGALLAEKIKAMGIGKVCFDRAGYKYHGRVKALAEGAREAGLNL